MLCRLEAVFGFYGAERDTKLEIVGLPTWDVHCRFEHLQNLVCGRYFHFMVGVLRSPDTLVQLADLIEDDREFQDFWPVNGDWKYMGLPIGAKPDPLELYKAETKDLEATSIPQNYSWQLQLEQRKARRAWVRGESEV